MYLKIEKINPDILKKAKDFFGKNFCNTLIKEKAGSFNESLVARYLIKKNSSKLNIFSSISHKKNLVFIAISERKIGIDIEIIKKRDENLLDGVLDFSYKKNIEYKILGGKNWKNFYFLWTAKESIIKIENLLLDDMKKIILKKVYKNIELKDLKKINLEKNIFSKKLIFEFKTKEFVVFSGEKNDKIFSICI